MRVCAVVLFLLTETFTNHDPTVLSGREHEEALVSVALKKKCSGGSQT